MQTIVSSVVLLLIMGTPACSVTKGPKGREQGATSTAPVVVR
jgi:hypothetical protein